MTDLHILLDLVTDQYCGGQGKPGAWGGWQWTSLVVAGSSTLVRVERDSQYKLLIFIG